MNLEQARFNMVEQQIRTWEVLDRRVLDLMARVPRECFVPEAYRELAFADTNIPLDHGQTMMAPRVEARMIQALEIETDDRVLEVGTGSGFVTALLADLARHVTSVELHGDLAETAARRLGEQGAADVSLRIGDASRGWSDGAPYDVIAVTGSIPVAEPAFEQQLAIGGRLFVIVGRAPAMEACLVRRVGDDQWITESLFETVLPPLQGAREPERFVF